MQPFLCGLRLTYRPRARRSPRPFSYANNLDFVNMYAGGRGGCCMSHARNAISTPILTELVRDELETVGRLSSVTDFRLRVAQSRAHRIVAVAVAPVALHSFSKVADRTPMRPFGFTAEFRKGKRNCGCDFSWVRAFHLHSHMKSNKD